MLGREDADAFTRPRSSLGTRSMFINEKIRTARRYDASRIKRVAAGGYAISGTISYIG